jgi:non-canonical (house-cleaning) NTP pyrophosphatase
MNDTNKQIIILLCSESPLKLKAVQEHEYFHSKNIKIDTINCSALGLPNQPINSTLHCAKARLEYARNSATMDYDYYISIENGLNIVTSIFSQATEECYTVIEHKGIRSTGKETVPIPHKYHNLLPRLPKNKIGTDVTFGEILKKQDISIDSESCNEQVVLDPKNWMKQLLDYDRVHMISDSIKNSITHFVEQRKRVDNVISKYKEYHDFPKHGQDLFAVLADPEGLKDLCKVMKNRYKTDNIDYIVGFESR